MAYQSVHGRTSLEAVGERLAKLEGRKRRYSKATVSDWIAEKSEPRLATFVALARLFGGMPSWYAFNYGTPPANPATEALQPVAAPPVQKRRSR